MAKIIIAGNAVVVTSKHTLEDIKTLEKYSPRALQLREKNEDDKMEVCFQVMSSTGKGALNNNGAAFTGATHDEAALATITLCIPEGVENVKEWVAEAMGPGLMKLNKVEKQFADALKAVKEDRDQIMENIQMM